MHKFKFFLEVNVTTLIKRILVVPGLLHADNLCQAGSDVLHRDVAWYKTRVMQRRQCISSANLCIDLVAFFEYSPTMHGTQPHKDLFNHIRTVPVGLIFDHMPLGR